MINLLFVGDGPRDEAMVPEIVEIILGERVEREFHGWARLHHRGSGRGYGRKLLYAVRQAQAGKTSGLVATLDADQRSRSERLRELSQARQELRRREPAFPTALGEAIPHGEAWLLDDSHSVRSVLGLGQEVAIPNVVRISDSKAALEGLLAGSSRAGERLLDILGEIARCVSLSRCPHAQDTGLEAFVNDVRAELGPLCSNSQ